MSTLIYYFGNFVFVIMGGIIFSWTNTIRLIEDSNKFKYFIFEGSKLVQTNFCEAVKYRENVWNVGENDKNSIKYLFVDEEL